VYPGCIQGVSSVYPGRAQFLRASTLYPDFTQCVSNVYPGCIQRVSRYAPWCSSEIVLRYYPACAQCASYRRCVRPRSLRRCCPNVSRVYPGCVQGVSRVYPVRANGATRANGASIVYPGCIHGVPAVYPAYFWRHGRFSRDVAGLYPVCIQCVSSVYSVCVQGAPMLPARPCCIQVVSRMSPCCIHGLLRIHGVPMSYPWCIPGVSRLFLIQRMCPPNVVPRAYTWCIHCVSSVYP
jgi:hypothetical protein